MIKISFGVLAFILISGFIIFIINRDESDQMIACTADVMVCPDRSLVERTGPDCEFVCPSSVEIADEGNTVETTQELNTLTHERSETDSEIKITVYLDEKSNTILSVTVPKEYGYLLEDFFVKEIPQEKALAEIYVTGSRFFVNDPNGIEMSASSDERIAEIRFCKENEALGTEVCKSAVTSDTSEHEWHFTIPASYHDAEMEIMKPLD